MKIYLGKSNMSNYDDVALFRKWAAENKVEIEEHVGGQFDESWPTRNKILVLIPYEPGFLGRGLYEMAKAAKQWDIKPYYAVKDPFSSLVQFKPILSVSVNDPDDWRYKYGIFTFKETPVNLISEMANIFPEAPRLNDIDKSNEDLLKML